MTWNITMLFVHFAALIALGILSRDAPDLLQKLVLGSLMCAAAILSYYYAAEAFDQPCTGFLAGVAHEIEHLAVLLYVFRIFVNDQERRCLRSSSKLSHNSPR